MKSLGLFTKSLLILLGLFGLTTVVLAVFMAWSIDQDLTSEFRRNGQDIAESIARSSVGLLFNHDPTTVQAMLDERGEGTPGISYILVIDEEGNAIAHTFVPSVPEEIRRLPGNPRKTTFHQIHVEGLSDSIDVCSAILAGQGGYVHVGMDRTSIREMIWGRTQQMVCFVGILFIVSVVLTFILTRKISQPLRRLTDAAQRLASGDTLVRQDNSSLPEWFPVGEGDDEVGELTRAFHRMVKEVTSRENGLKQQFKLLLDSTAEAIYGIDLNGNCIFCNPACAKLLGYESAEHL